MSDVPVIGSDFCPTILAAAGLAPPADRRLDGIDLLPLLAGGGGERTVPMYWRFGGKVAYREGDWKVVADESLEHAELYNLRRDRDEQTNLADTEAAQMAAMLGRLKAHTAEIEAEGPDWWRTERQGEGGTKRRAKPVPAG